MIKSLLAKLRKKDTQSERILFEMFYQRVYNTAYLMVRDPHLAQDIVQETFLKAFSQIHKLKDGNKMEAWLISIATRTALDHLRKIKRRTDFVADDVYINEMASQHEFQLPVETIVEQNIIKEILREELAKLKPEYTQVLILKYGYEWKEQAIADALNVSVSTVKTRLRRARQVLKLAVEKRWNEREGDSNGHFTKAQSR
ncbi:RNA polymerase sigma factor [Effusibacillus pohliae]|uniref:RNA polymerase sigma factor n=1 Tax=Effusibacillus pohliae TaxID=232270 RepID=UPI000366F94B|nr:RNA polymerase sigma factor [Effusibacillus pohliae]